MAAFLLGLRLPPRKVLLTALVEAFPDVPGRDLEILARRSLAWRFDLRRRAEATLRLSDREFCRAVTLDGWGDIHEAEAIRLWTAPFGEPRIGERALRLYGPSWGLEPKPLENLISLPGARGVDFEGLGGLKLNPELAREALAEGSPTAPLFSLPEGRRGWRVVLGPRLETSIQEGTTGIGGEADEAPSEVVAQVSVENLVHRQGAVLEEAVRLLPELWPWGAST